MIDPIRATPSCSRSVAATAEASAPARRPAQFSVDDLRDLQVWHKLVWVDHFYVERDQRVQLLIAKGRGFTEEDKLTLRAIELEILRQVVPEYRGRSARDRSSSRRLRSITRSCRCCATPTSTCARTRIPGCRASASGIRRTPPSSSPARSRCTNGSSAANRKALWPSEGSVSDAMVPLVAEAGLQVDGDRRGDPVEDARARLYADRRRSRRAARAALSRLPRRAAGDIGRHAGSATTRCPT